MANPYYAGVVRYGGVEYEGKHEPLIDEDTFSRVQAVLRAHAAAGEKDRKHHHYLKGSLVCKRCGSRLTYIQARSRSGAIYSYFACIKRVAAKTCDLPYLPAAETEQRVAAAYADIKVQQVGTKAPAVWAAHIDDVRAALGVALRGMREANERTTRQQRKRLESIKAQQRKLLDAFLTMHFPETCLPRSRLPSPPSSTKPKHCWPSPTRTATSWRTYYTNYSTLRLVSTVPTPTRTP